MDLDAEHVERWRPDNVDPEIVTAVLTWMPTSAQRPFNLDLRDFFVRLHSV
jgi:hypothetical protein